MPSSPLEVYKPLVIHHLYELGAEAVLCALGTPVPVSSFSELRGVLEHSQHPPGRATVPVTET